MGRPARRCSGREARSKVHGLEAGPIIPSGTPRPGLVVPAHATAAMVATVCNVSPTSLTSSADVNPSPRRNLRSTSACGHDCRDSIISPR